MLQHRTRYGLCRGQHAGDVHSQDAVACVSRVGQRGRFVLDPDCSDEAVETGVRVGDAGDKGEQN